MFSLTLKKINGKIRFLKKQSTLPPRGGSELAHT